MRLRVASPQGPRAGFSLLEMIGVLAIMAVLASAVAPNVLRSIERAAIRAEMETLQTLGGQMRLMVRETGAPPTSTSWATALGAYTDLAPTDLAVNRRNVARVYLADPAANPSPRVMILSSMRSGLALPTASSVNNAASFQDIWDTADGSVPPATSWSGWSSWNAVSDSGEFLLIERVNLRSLYLTELQTFTVTLNNTSGSSGGGNAYVNVFAHAAGSANGKGNGNDKGPNNGGGNGHGNGNGNGNGQGNGNGNGGNGGGGNGSGNNNTPGNTGAVASYRIISANGTASPVTNLSPGASVVLSDLHARERIDLYQGSGGVGFDYSYVISDSGKTFDFDGATWVPR